MYRKKGSPYWWIKFRDASGRTVEQSTQTTDRGKAALVESEKRAAIWQETQRGIVPLADPLFDEVLADYLESAQRRRDIERDRSLVRALSRSFQGMTIRGITTTGMVRDYLAQRRKDAVSDSSIKRELGLFSAAISAWNRCHTADTLPNPAANLDLQEPPGRVRWLTHEDADALVAVAHTSRAEYLADFIRLALHTGMRKGEMLGLAWSRVDFSQNLIYLDTQKNGQRGSVPLNQVARQALLNRARFRAEHCPAAPHVFCNRQGQRIQDVKRPFKAACQAAGIEDFRVHDLRHTCASWLVQAGVPLLEVSQVLRHANIMMTQRYAHLAPTSARHAVARLEAGDNPAKEPLMFAEKTAG